jgi:uncharacterized protein (DUF2141 family)
MKRWALLPWAVLAWGQDAGTAAPAAPAAVGVTLTVEISGIEPLEGNLMLALHDHAGDFPKVTAALRTNMVKVTSNPQTITFADVPPGTYAVGVVQDVNANGKLDTKMFGMPAEPIGVSNNAKGRFGPPKFDDAKFAVGKVPLKLAITLGH